MNVVPGHPATGSRWCRLVRRLGLDRNPLRRTVDRIDRWTVLVVVGLFLFAAPVLAWRVGHTAYAAGIHAERAGTHRVDAVLLADPTRPSAASGMPSRRSIALARWTAPDGTPRTEHLLVDAGSRSGQVVPVWTDATGEIVPAARRRSDTVTQTLTAVLSVTFALAGGLAGLRWAVRRALDRRRMALWDAAWRQIAPHWTGRR
jgi:hypothetical protein